MTRSIAAVTMAYNEKNKLSRWVRHYEREIGAGEHLFVLDHGSDDGSTLGLGAVNRVPVARTPGFNQTWRANYVSEFCSALLDDYDYVLYSDADELIVADPARFSSISEYVATTDRVRNTTIGYDVLHDLRKEPDLTDGPVFGQRSKMQFVAAMCKTAIISEPVRWAPGFHCSTHAPEFGDLFTFHLRYADFNEGKERLTITRAIDRPDMATVKVDHQKLTDEMFESWIKSWVNLKLSEGGIGLENPEVKAYVDAFEFKRAENGMYQFDYSFRSRKLYAPPPELKDRV